MKNTAAYLLAVLGGNTNPTAEDLKHILGSVGAESEDEKIQLLLSRVKAKDLTELIAAGRLKLAAMPSGGAVEGPAAAAAAVAVVVAAAPKEEEKIEEEPDDDMCFSLFD